LNLAKLFELQRQLDEHIMDEHPELRGQDNLPWKLLALQVELGELANEWRGFKHWSRDKNPRREKMLEEYADCLSFIMELAIELGYEADDLYVWDDYLEGSTIDLFNEMFFCVGKIRFSNDENEKKQWFKSLTFIFFNMAEQRLEFSWEQIEKAYLQKNAVNHARQEQGY
jgi:dimeric dUTPase (all-alpha-NTP-PPase superfamily)